MRVRVRLFAMQRELAGHRELRLELPAGATVEDAWAALVASIRRSPPGRSVGAVRASTASTPTRTTALADGDELALHPAGQRRRGRRPERAAADPRAPRGAVRHRDLGRAGRPARDRRGRRDRRVPRPDARVARDAGAGPGSGGGAARRSARRGAGVRGPRADGASRSSTGSPTRSRSGSASSASRSSTGPARCRSARSSVAVVAVVAPPRRGVRGGPLRDRRDEGAGARSGRRSGSPTATSGSASRHGPARRRRRRRGRGGAVKVYISVDMEGIAGDQPSGPDGPRRQRLPGGRRAHGRRGERRDRGRVRRRRDRGPRQRQPRRRCTTSGRPSSTPGARLLQGQKAWSMVAGAGPDAGFGVALFVGYHARAGHPRGTIAHTYSGRPTATRLNGRLVGETGINAASLGAWGVPVGLVAGDDALAEEVADWLPWAERVVVKDAAGGNAAASLHPAAAARADPEPARSGPCDGRLARAGCGRSRSSRPVVDRGRLRERRLRRLRGGRARGGAGRRPRGALRGAGSRCLPIADFWPASGSPASSMRATRVRAALAPTALQAEPYGPIDRLAERAETLAGAWAARARTSTTVGRERALLRLFGVGGLDAAGRPLAWAVVDRYLAGGRRRLGGGVVMPFAMALVEYDLTPQRLALDVASGAVDLGHGGRAAPRGRPAGRRRGGGPAPRRTPRSSGSTPTGPPGASCWTCSATRAGRGSGVASPSPRSRRRSTPPAGAARRRRRPRPGRGPDRARADRAPPRRAGMDAPVWRGRAEDAPLGGPRPCPDGQPARPDRASRPARRDRGPAPQLRPARGRAAARSAHRSRRSWPRSSGSTSRDSDPMIEIIAGRVAPDRALADHAFAHALLARAGVVVSLSAGPLVVAPDLARGVPSDPATRAGRALAIQALAVAIARGNGVPDELLLVGAVPGLARRRVAAGRPGRGRGRDPAGALPDAGAVVRGAAPVDGPRVAPGPRSWPRSPRRSGPR